MLIGDREFVSKCLYCKSDLESGAIKCAQCGSFQNWRKYGSFLVIAAGFVLTWLSIWTAPPIKALFDQKAEMRISILEGSFTQVTFMLSNVGNSPAALSNINISAVLGSGVKPTWYLSSDLDNTILKPNQAHIIKASNDAVIPSFVPHEIQVAYYEKYGLIDKSCDLILEYVQLNGTKEYLSYPFACNTVDPMNSSKPFEKD
jgi:hypothetical protein